ncbi:hypothetical protein GCU67_05165 [Modestobacter muralis]|uniref:Uncharacterized protein n=1 Tax=Modestobacter muralis TaxID=1608614 RepID=A0A6P0ES19_9ACTN|nr:hypothetical protein [Modestobacter muralis]NEK93566.1 hypothetical protein [Modestobacter muralis]NEN50333.1 hypothetical protein [Modestobacter muralis]
MTRPADDRPTTVLPQQTVEQPSVTTSPATRRSYTWHRRIPARIGRARTSTVVIGALFVLLGGLNVVLPTDPYVTVPTEYGDVRVRSSQLARTPAPTSTPASEAPSLPATTEAPETTATTSAPGTTPGEDRETPSPSSTRSSVTEDEETTAPTTSAEPTSSSRSTASSEPSQTAGTATPTGTADPTG